MSSLTMMVLAGMVVRKHEILNKEVEPIVGINTPISASPPRRMISFILTAIVVEHNDRALRIYQQEPASTSPMTVRAMLN